MPVIDGYFARSKYLDKLPNQSENLVRLVPGDKVGELRAEKLHNQGQLRSIGMAHEQTFSKNADAKEAKTK